ncbi:MAG: LysM peptidoglycan-binding domain-containing protein [Bacteroidales bacterium]|nr:LysM peptidoglycan-binding domain-containing protein [Bacteroidales bacterium]
MEIKAKNITTWCVTVFLLISGILTASSQVVVEKSKDKVIISGTVYYVHIVKKGETAYSIARAYNITVEELNRENPPAVYGINEGQSLRIPFRETPAGEQVSQETVQQKRDDARFIYHRLQPGETVYRLSKLYGVSENEIIDANPGREISRLPVNAVIAVPRREFMAGRQEFAAQDSDYIFHRVIRGESLASIAEKYGLSVRDLRKENRNIRFPQVGDFLRIPVVKKVVEPVTAELLPDSMKKDSSSIPVLLPRPSGYTPVSNLRGSMDVAVLLPFYLRENAVRSDIDSSRVVKGRRVYRVIKRNEDWIYPASLGFLEMYQGILLAADTLRSVGLDISLHVYDIRSDTVELTRLINRGALAEMDLIIGPVYSHNLEIMTAYAGPLGIPVVSPVPLFSNSLLSGNPSLFMANASLEVAQDAIARKAGEYFDNNFVFIHSDTAGVDPDVKNFKHKIFAELTNRLPYEEIRFKELIFYSRSKFGNDSINRLSHALSEDLNNTVIIASEETPVISETLQEIHSLARTYPVKVFGYPAMRSAETLDLKYLFDLDILIFSPYWIDYSKRDVRKFNADYHEKFLTEPDEMSYSWLGYDITYYFLSGIAIHGKEFTEHPEIHNPDLLYTKFDFRRKTTNDGFENHKLYTLRFTKDYVIQLLPETDPEQ